jgi:ABC-type branched-subunit amino acid transport system ATPase component
MLSIKNISKNYGGVKAVNDCSFSIDAGKITALIGPNGSGKSTIFNLICGIDKPDKGEIFFKNTNLNKLNIEQISNLGISRLFQQSRLFRNLTIRENLLVSINNQDLKFWHNIFKSTKVVPEKEVVISNVLKTIEMDHMAEHFTSELSFGQKRLVEIGRALLNPHQLLILDEPVAGVTPRLRDKVADLIRGEKNIGNTIFFIEHDMSFTLGIADEIIVIDAGRIIARGTPVEIKNNQKVLEAYLGC